MTTPAAHSKAGRVLALIEAAHCAGLRVVEIAEERGRVTIRTAPLDQGGQERDDRAEEWLRANGAG